MCPGPLGALQPPWKRHLVGRDQRAADLELDLPDVPQARRSRRCQAVGVVRMIEVDVRLRLLRPDARRPMIEVRSRREAHATGRYLPIADHGVIGNLRTAALVGTNGAIDWLCWPR